MLKILSLVGARPQFIKEALLGSRVRALGAWDHILVHSGQHYDINMSDVFFEELGIPTPRYHLGVGSGSHGAMTAAILTAMEKVLLTEKPNALLVYGDTNTTLAGALAAAKLHIPIIHVEAGIRMLPRTMPEEINRVLTDRLASVLCCCSQLGADNLRREGITSGVEVTGDIMLDVFRTMQSRFSPDRACSQWHVAWGEFAVMTLHRDYNVDNLDSLRSILDGLSIFASKSKLKILFIAHPRTQKRLQEISFQGSQNIRLLPPQGYFELMSLVSAAAFVITDSGGLQKEAYYAKKRAVVIMQDAGWKELIDCGWNILTAPHPDKFCIAAYTAMQKCPYIENIYGIKNVTDHIIKNILQYYNI